MANQKSMEELLMRCAEGDKASFRILYDHLRGDLFHFVRARVSTRDEALDILQEVFIDLWSSLRRGKFAYSSHEGFYRFLYTICRRKIARSYNMRAPTVSLEDIVGVEDPGEGNLEPGEAAIVLSTLQSLNGLDQEIMRLRYFSGLTFAEIAGLLGRREGSIKVRHHRALAKLKDILGYEKQ